MNIDELKEIIKAGESDALEFKESTGQLTAAAKSLCAFLNHRGGVLLFGVKDKGAIIGQEVSDKTKRQIIAELNNITPKVDFEIKYVEVNSLKKVVVVHAVPDKEKAPYMYKGRAYWREQTTTSIMGQGCYDRIIANRLQLDRKWDKQITEKYSVRDLDSDEIKNCIEEGVNSKRLPEAILNQTIDRQLEKLKLLNDGKLNNAAVILFAKELDLSFMHCRIKLGRFVGNDTAKGFVDEKEYTGNVFSILNEAEIFIKRHINIAISFSDKSFKRDDKPDLPALAIRETLLNSVCHRDYLQRGSVIKIAIFDDRMEIWNPGKLLPGITLDELKLPVHTSLHRNELIAQIFYIRGFIEGWGTGTARMISLCRKHGIHDPIFSQRGEGFLVTFRLGKFIDQLSERKKQILNILTTNALSVAGIKQELDKVEKVTIRTVSRDLKHLQELGLIKSTGAGRSLVWGRT